MSTIAVGSVIDGLRLDAIAGRGGSSVVYRATELSSGTAVAVKVLHDPNPSSTKRLRREAELLAELYHPGVVPFHRLIEHGGDLLLVTSWIDGQPLSEPLRHGEVRSAPEVAELLAKLAQPLDYLHMNGVVHRDVSPSNIIERPDGSLVLLDLGIGHNVATATMTNDALLAGSPKFLAPEIIRGEPASDRSDQYSAAVLAHELLTGMSPFPDSGEIATALHHQVNTAPTPLNEVDPSIPEPLAAAVLRALAKDPAARFASIGDFAAAAAAPAPASSVASDPPGRSGASGRKLFGAAALATAATVAAVLLWPAGAADNGVVPPDSNEVALPAPALEEADNIVFDDEVRGLIAVPDSGDVSIDDGTTGTAEDDVSAAAVTTAWEAGLAASLACNALEGSDFANGSVPLDYFGDPPGREQVVEAGGLSDSWALEIGVANDFGQYAEIVPVATGDTYWFRGWFTFDGVVENAEMGITLIDADYQGLDLSVSAPITETGFVEVQLAEVPDNAAFALPYLYKDASPGVLLADELVFGMPNTCFPEITAAGD